MKKFVILTSNKLVINLVKSKIMINKKYKVTGNSTGCIQFKSNNNEYLVSFKKINPNRPSDLSRYSNETYFCFINFYKSKEAILLKELKENLKKDIKIQSFTHINEFILYLENDKLNKYYLWDPQLLTPRLFLSYAQDKNDASYIAYCKGSEIFDNIDDALNQSKINLEKQISKLEEEIKEKTEKLETLKTILKNS